MPDAPAMRLYSELAPLWPIFSAPADYAEEAAFYLLQLVAGCARPPATCLELGSGGGNNASHMKASLQLTLVDVSAGMLDVSRRLNPECEHVQGDMRTVRLGRQFDCVFGHDAIMYMATEADLRAAVETAWVHCAPGGCALFAPDSLVETFRPGTDHGGHDGNGESVRYLEWTWDPDPDDTSYTVDYIVAVRGADGALRVTHDRHTEGLFRREQWLRILSEAGFEPSVVPFDHSELEPGTYELFLARRPA